MKRSDVIVLVLVVCGFAAAEGCPLGPTAKSAYDIGVELCQLFYGQHAELRHAMSPADVCKIAEVVQPFVDHASKSGAEAGARSSAALSRKTAAATAPAAP